MDLGFWYYTLSAIPQALAATIAVVATFVIYKVSRVSDRTEREKDSIKRFILVLNPEQEIHHIESMRGWDVLRALREGLEKLDKSKEGLGFGGYAKLEKLFKEIVSDWQRSFEVNEARIYEFLHQKADVLHRLVNTRKRSLRYLIVSLVIATIPSALAFLALPHIGFFYTVANANLFVTIMTILSSLSFVYTSFSVWKIARA